MRKKILNAIHKSRRYKNRWSLLYVYTDSVNSKIMKVKENIFLKLLGSSVSKNPYSYPPNFTLFCKVY